MFYIVKCHVIFITLFSFFLNGVVLPGILLFKIGMQYLEIECYIRTLGT